MPPAGRYDRLHTTDRADDQRMPGQRDRDRVLYTSALRRLDGVTQVVAAGERHIFHNRLTHTLEVAQVARRLAEKLIQEQGAGVAQAVGGVDPEVVEAAALAHDLGHPPFGHIAEEELDAAVKARGVADGFEGNAQSFRVVTKLAIRHPEFRGLNLTRATLNAILKYPWLRQTSGKPSRKWGAYHTERQEFRWARELGPAEETKSAEAELMDWADDIAYSVHDVEDFYRAGLIPLDQLRNEETLDRILDNLLVGWKRGSQEIEYSEEEYKSAFKELAPLISVTEPFSGTRKQRADLRSLTSFLIGRYIGAIRLDPTRSSTGQTVKTASWAKIEISMWKQLTWHYVIHNPSLATQQYGQRRVVRGLFDIFMDAATSEQWHMFPVSSREQLEELAAGPRVGTVSNEQLVRVVADMIAGLTERQAVDLYQRLTGVAFGSVLETIVS
jgi:dGTPase